MRVVQLSILSIAIVLPLGCSWLEKIKGNGGGGGGGGVKTPITQVGSAQLVDYLNTQASRMQSITFDRATVTAKEGLISYPSLRGDLAAAQPRYFRMRGEGGMVAAKIDLGSNPDQFWMFLDAPTARPMFVFASHSDFESGKARLPGNIPFEPDWVMQALGMTTFPKEANYEVKPDDKVRTYTLSWPGTTPTGLPIRKEIIFAADDADSSRNQPQVKRHIIRDVKGKVICYAEVKKAKTVPIGGTDPRTGQPMIAQYPTHVVLRWEEQRFEMDMMLDGGQVNPQLPPEKLQKHFTRPTIQGAPAINLAEARFDMSGRGG